MSTFDNGTTWNGIVTLSKQTGTKITIPSKNTYLDKNIEVTVNAPTASPSFSGGGLSSVTRNVSAVNLTYSLNNTSGIAITPKVTYVRDAVVYNGAVNGWVNKNDQDSAMKSSQGSFNHPSYYITGVTLTNGKSFDITVPNGSSGAITYHFSVDANGNTTVT